MKIFDFNIHLPCRDNSSVKNSILDENSMSLKELEFCYSTYLADFRKTITAGNFMIFNQNIFLNSNLSDFIKNIKFEFKNSLFTALIDFRRSDVMDYLDSAIMQGINSIKFHSYNQKISEADFISIVQICQYAEQKGLIISLDTSYGSSKMYDYDNLKLACFISDFITKVPIVLLHSGGARVIEAMLLADDKKNIFLETSFSIVYYLGSSLERDFAYAFKKIGAHRVIYGSDAPYININGSIDKTVKFLQEYKFSTQEIENIVFDNTSNLKDFNA